MITQWLPEGMQRAWYRFTQNPSSLVGLIMVLIVLFITAFAPFITPHPSHSGKVVNFSASHEPPSLKYPFGTDGIGRDILSRTFYGFRISLQLALFVLAIGVPVGVVLGLLAGYYGGWVETLIMRFTDMVLSLPPLVMALTITAVLTPNLRNAMIALAAIWWTWHARLVHSIAQSVKNEEYVIASEVLGASDLHVMFREILPNCVSAILVKITLDIGFVILLGSGLSFLGLGVQPPRPGLGTMVAEGVTYLPGHWWESIFPGLAILFAVLGFNLLGDGLRDMFDVEV